MDDLAYALKRMCRETKDGSFGTRSGREKVLVQAAVTLRDLGYTRMRPDSIKPKHVDALVKHWQKNELTPGTIKNRLAHLRWWAESVNKASVVARDNQHYGVENRVYVSGQDKSRSLDEKKLNSVTDPYVRMSLELQKNFGLRREESIKFIPNYADKGDRIVLKSSWTKGGKPREIPVRNEAQRLVLDRAKRLVGGGALIPQTKNYIQQLRVYERTTFAAGLDKNHGLRHAYAQERYRELTGRDAPAKGGPARNTLSPAEREADNVARMTISRELGHERTSIVAIYIG